MNGFRKALPLFIVYFLASVVAVTIGMGGSWWRQEIGLPVVKTAVGSPNFINTANYDPQTGAALAATTANAAGNTQNIQAPTISGFSSDLFTGGASVNYSLDLPPGRGGLTPSLSLNYSSNSVYDSVMGRDVNDDLVHNLQDIKGGDGRESWYDQLLTQSSQIGLGWDLGGLGSVFRDANNRYTLILNGQSYRLFKSLEPNGEWDWGAGKWHTDPTGFLKIEHPIDKLFNDEPRPGEAAPKNFKVTDTSGTTYTFEPKGYYWKRCDCRDFGCKANDGTWCPNASEAWATFYNKWVLTTVTDVHSNEIRLSYTQENQAVTFNPNGVAGSTYPRAIYPTEINYSGSGADFSAKVAFVFESREDWKNLRWGPLPDATGNPGPDADQTFFSVKRIAGLDIKVKKGGNWETVRQYELDNDQYFESVRDTTCESAAASGFCNLHPKLTKITAKGLDGASLPPHTFDYHENQQDYNNFRLLRLAANGYGGSVEYGYGTYTINDYDPKTGTWWEGTIWGAHRVTEKTANDGRDNSFKTSYAYPLNSGSSVGISDDRYHSGFESVGHRLVAESVFAKNGGSKLRETKYYFIQGKSEGGKFYVQPERGRLESSGVYDGSGTLLSSAATDYLRDPDDKGGVQNDIWNTPHFIAAEESSSCQDINTGWPVGSKTTYHYRPEDQNGQQWGNLTHSTEYKVTDCNFDQVTAYRTTHNTYLPNEATHITNRVVETETFAGLEDRRLALGWNSYDDKGSLILARAFHTFPEGAGEAITGQTVDSKFEYDGFGNLTTTTTYDGYGQSGTARTSTIKYEGTYNTFPVLTTNPLGHQNRTGYWRDDTEVGHPYLANKIFTWDPNNQQSTAVLDGLGRVVSSFLPGEGVASVKIDYRDANPFIVHTQTRDDKDDGGAATYHHTWQIYNGLGQLVETQTEQENDGQKIALTFKDYNALGQVEKELLPYDPGVAGGNLVAPNWSQPYNETFYDSLGRATKTIAPGNRITQTAYYGRKTAVLDANQHLRVSEVDALGRLVEVQEFKNKRGLGVPADYYTKTLFDYDYLDRLKTTTDTLGNVSTISYNQSGQKISSDDPDLGLWRYTYYPTGTLAAVTDAKDQVKSFIYDDLDRIKFKFYGGTNTQPVANFGYDNCQNGIGRLCSDLTANLPEQGFLGAGTVYNYDAKGRLASETKRIEATNYVTSFAYDAAGRQREITYPDGEKVAYAYNEAGLLNDVAGASTYLSSAKYNILGQPEEEVLGAGDSKTTTAYTYEPQTYRLDTKTVKDKNGADLWSQNLDYDPVGNITSITYPLRKSSSFPELPFKIDYTYDDLNRLTGGKMAGLIDEAAREVFYTGYEYDQLGRMTFKEEEGEKELCYKTVAHDVGRDTLLLAFNLSETERAWITFDFFDDSGKELLFVGDWAQPKNDSIEIGERSHVPVLVKMVSGLPSNYHGYVEIESHNRINYPGSDNPDDHGPCITVEKGPAEAICAIYPESTWPRDLDCDCRVSVADVMRVAAIWNTEAGDPKYNPNYNFDNKDDRISIADVMYVAAKWNTQCPD